MSGPAGAEKVTWGTPGLLGWCALAVLAIGLVIAFGGTRGFVEAMLEKSVGDGDRAAREQEQRLEQYETDLRSWMAQVKGRSMFFVPPSPEEIVAVDEPEEVPEEIVEEDLGPPPKPTRYGGPNVIAVVNNSVWIASGTMIPVGDEAEGVRVVSVEDAPWSVRLEWREVEFDVPLFERTTQRFLRVSEPSSGS